MAASNGAARRRGDGDRREFGRRVRARREALGLRPEELADWLGVTTREVLQLEAGLSEPGSVLRQRLRTVLREPDETGPMPLADAVDEFLRRHRQRQTGRDAGF